MRYVVFENDGEIDTRAIRTFGISAKESENPIGFFGTGLKYAISILLREGHSIEIYSGEQRYVFEEKPVVVRGQNFNVVAMNGEELSFTTRVGVNWKMWQAFREIYCNCIDEGGSAHLSMKKPNPTPGKTYVVVKGKEFTECFYNKKDIVLELSQDLLVHGNGRVDIYNMQSNSIYYRGIKVDTTGPSSALYTYNILTEQVLTEDRTLRYSSSALTEISKAVMGLKDANHIKRIVLTDDERDVFEKSFCYSIFHDECSPEFLDTVEKEYLSNNDQLSKHAVAWYMTFKNKRYAKDRTSVPMNDVEKKQLTRATTVCRKLFDDFDTYPIVIVKTLGQNTLALADMEEKVIIVSKECFERGTKYLVSTLIEEYLHIKTGYGDCSRALQTYLFDKICTMTEQYVLGEPI